MATSSIKTNFVIKGEEQIEAFVEAFEASKDISVSVKKVSSKQVSEINELKEIMRKRKRYDG